MNPANRGHPARVAQQKRPGLLTQSEAADHLLIAGSILAGEVFQEAIASGDHHQQAAARRVVFFVGSEVLGQLRNSLGEQGDLDFGRACIFFVNFVVSEDLLFLFNGNRHRNST